MTSELETELRQLLNRHSVENGSGTPDFILAGFLLNVLLAYNAAQIDRARWRGESIVLPALSHAQVAKRTTSAHLVTIPWPPSDDLVHQITAGAGADHG